MHESSTTKYSEDVCRYQRYVVTKKSLEMKTRMNEVWSLGRIGPKAEARRKLIDECKEKLSKLEPVIKPVKPTVWYVYNRKDACFEFCIPDKGLDAAKLEAEEALGKGNYIIKQS